MLEKEEEEPSTRGRRAAACRLVSPKLEEKLSVKMHKEEPSTIDPFSARKRLGPLAGKTAIHWRRRRNEKMGTTQPVTCQRERDGRRN